MSERIAPYNHPIQVQGREPHVHDFSCTWNGEACDKQEGLPNNQNWDPKTIASPSPIDRATHVARKVKSTAAELMGSLREHFDGGEPASAPAPFVPPTAPPRKVPDAIPMYTEDTPYKERITKDRTLMTGAADESHMHNVSTVRSIIENAARRLKNHVAGAPTGGTHLMTWTRGDTYGEEQTTNRVQGPNGESVGGENVKLVKKGDLALRDPYQLFDEHGAAHQNKRTKGPGLGDFMGDTEHQVLKPAEAGLYHIEHRVTLTREGELTHKTKSMTLHGAQLTTRQDPGGKPYNVVTGAHQEGTPDSRGVAPHLAINPDHIQKVEIHVRKGTGRT